LKAQETKRKLSERKAVQTFQSGRTSVLTPLAVGILGLLVAGAVLVALNFGIEVEAPTIEVTAIPPFVGNEAVQVDFRARDTGSGVDSVSVAIEQAGVLLPVGRFAPDGVMYDFPGSFTLSKSGAGLREGLASLNVEVRDRSLWGSMQRTATTFVVDSYSPSLQVLSAPRTIDAGGVGLFVYKAGDANLTSSGVSVDGNVYALGKPAVLMDTDLLDSDLFAVVAASPPGEHKEWAVFASDVAGHTARELVKIEVGSSGASGRSVREFASEGLLMRLLAGLSSDIVSALPESERSRLESLRQGLENGGRKAVVGFVDYLIHVVRERELSAIRERLNAEPATPRRWKGEFFTGSFAPRIAFGDTVGMGDDDGDFVSWISRGEVLEPIGDTKSVVAPYAGAIRMAGRLGTLGEIVVVDHGLGVASVFYSLGQRQVFEGAVVAQGQALADIGISGLHATKAARMLFLVNGQPVDPAPWRQSTGFGFAVEGALNGIKGALGIESSATE
jgi:hypothetical protein